MQTEEKKQHILEDKAAAYDKLLADQDPDTEERYCVDFAAAAAPGFVRAGYLEDEESTPAKERRLNDGSSSPRDQHGTGYCLLAAASSTSLLSIVAARA